MFSSTFPTVSSTHLKEDLAQTPQACLWNAPIPAIPLDVGLLHLRETIDAATISTARKSSLFGQPQCLERQALTPHFRARTKPVAEKIVIKSSAELLAFIRGDSVVSNISERKWQNLHQASDRGTAETMDGTVEAANTRPGVGTMSPRMDGAMMQKNYSGADGIHGIVSGEERRIDPARLSSGKSVPLEDAEHLRAPQPHSVPEHLKWAKKHCPDMRVMYNIFSPVVATRACTS